MHDKGPEDPNLRRSSKAAPRLRSAILLTVALLGLAAAFLLRRPFNRTDAPSSPASQAAPTVADTVRSPTRRPAAGVGEREVDKPRRAPTPVADRPAMELDWSPQPEPEDPTPTFDSTQEEVEWVEQTLANARANLTRRAEFLGKFHRRRERLKATHGDGDVLAAYDERGTVVQANYERALAEVATLEERLAVLQTSL